jgi:hypothetical protein
LLRKLIAKLNAYWDEIKKTKLKGWKQIVEQLKTMVGKLTVHDKLGKIFFRKKKKGKFQGKRRWKTMLIFILGNFSLL